MVYIIILTNNGFFFLESLFVFLESQTFVMKFVFGGLQSLETWYTIMFVLKDIEYGKKVFFYLQILALLPWYNFETCLFLSYIQFIGYSEGWIYHDALLINTTG